MKKQQIERKIMKRKAREAQNRKKGERRKRKK